MSPTSTSNCVGRQSQIDGAVCLRQWSRQVFRYAYLWDRESQEGREEGEKDRPCLVLAIVALDEEGIRTVRVLPITHAPPPAMRSKSRRGSSRGSASTMNAHGSF